MDTTPPSSNSRPFSTHDPLQRIVPALGPELGINQMSWICMQHIYLYTFTIWTIFIYIPHICSMGRLYIYRHFGWCWWKMSSFMELFWVFGRVTKSSQFSARSVAFKKANQDLWNLVGGAPNLLHSTPTSPTSRLTRRNIKFSLWLGVPPRFWVVFCSDLNLGSALFWGACKLQEFTPKMLNQWTELSTLKRATSWNAKCPIFLGNFTP